jgi:hypothetical protein
MTEQPPGGRDVLAELDSIGEYMASAVFGEHPAPGLLANKPRFAAELAAVRSIAENSLELKADYDSGGTHEARIARSMAMTASPPEHGELERLRARVAELEGRI